MIEKKICEKKQILNPITNRCVQINGATAKEVINKHLNNQLKLDALDLQKINDFDRSLLKKNEKPRKQEKADSKATSKATTSEESKATSKATTAEESKATSKATTAEESKATSKATSKSESKATSKSDKSDSKSESSESSSSSDESEKPKKAKKNAKPPKFKKTKEYKKLLKKYAELNLKIKDLKVDLEHKKEYKAEQLLVKEELIKQNPDVKFIKKNLPKAYDFNEPISVTKLNKISDNVKNKLANYLKHIKDQRSITYLNKEHQEACTQPNFNKSNLTIPIKSEYQQLELPMVKNPFAMGMSFAALDNPKIDLVNTKTTPISYSWNNYNKQLALNLFDPTLDYSVNTDWFKEMNNYINTLPKEDIFTILGYTYHGDEWANNHMRGKFQQTQFYSGLKSVMNTWLSAYMPVFFQAKSILHRKNFIPSLYVFKDDPVKLLNPPAYSHKYDPRLTSKEFKVSEMLELLNKEQDLSNSNIYMVLASMGFNLKPIFWMESIELFAKDLNRIIMGSPPLKTKLVVFRGVKNDYYLKGSNNNYYKNRGFVSTSLSYKLAKSFSGGLCCLKRIVLLPGSRALFISGLSRFPHEIELLLPVDTIFYIRNAKKTLPYYTSDHDRSHDICGKNMTKIYCTDVIVIK